MDARIKVKRLNTGAESLVLPSQNKKDTGNVGRYYETHLIDRGFVLDRHGVIDIPGLNIESKTRKRGSMAPHTTGTMTKDHIIATPWASTEFAKKLQQQNRMMYDDNFHTVVNESVYDFRNPSIQQKLEESYENARARLRSGKQLTRTIVGGDFGVLEHKKGNTYAHRIPESGMRRLEAMAKSTVNKLFDWD